MSAVTDLSAEIKKQMIAEMGGCTQKFSDALARAIITYFESKAKVNVTSVSGVTTGPGVSGPGTGTITFPSI